MESGAASACALLVALVPLPYSYYQLLRWGVCLSAAVLGIGRWNQAPYSGSALILIALLFNPLDPITFTRGTWAILDFAAAAVFGWVALHPRQDRTA